MYSPSDRRRHKASTGDLSNKGDRKSRPFDDVLTDYEKFASGERLGLQGDKAAVAHQYEVIRSSTSGCTEVQSDRSESAEVSSSEDLGESEGIVPRVEEMNDSSLTALEGHKVLIPRATNSPTHPPQCYVVISSHHFSAGLKFPLPNFLIRILNMLELALMQLTPNAYTQLLSFYLIFRMKRIGSLTDNIFRHCFQMKKCPK
ncbi:hypothetical protein ACOSQ4_021463 [Xanthoceras sorbifolium]